MTLTNEIKLLDGEIKGNQAQYDLDREALSSKELDKYEYLTCKNFEWKFEYSPRAFNKVLDEKDQIFGKVKNY